jgi:hypothetical protein
MINQPQDPNPKIRSIELLEHLLDASETQNAIISDLANEIRDLVAILTTAAQAISRPAGANTPTTPIQPTSNLTFQDFTASGIIMTYNDKGEPAYKIVGFPFATFGVRVWPEVLPALGINPDELRPGPNPYSAQVRALMVESSSKPGTMTPKKIIGPAPIE